MFHCNNRRFLALYTFTFCDDTCDFFAKFSVQQLYKLTFNIMFGDVQVVTTNTTLDCTSYVLLFA